LVWLLVVIIGLSITRNPLYLLLVLLVLEIIEETCQQGKKNISTLQFALVILLTSSIFNGLTSHFGATVLFRLPEQIPLFGGSITLEALGFGAINGLVLAGIFAVFKILNQALPVREMIRIIPPAFYPLAVVTSIALTFTPETIHQFHQIREAQQVRGNHMRSPKDWLPLILSLLTGGLERSLQLAESMTARGFASRAHQTHAHASRILLALGLVLLLAGAGLQVAAVGKGLENLLTLAGAGLILAGLWLAGRGAIRPVFHPQPWNRRDTVMVCISAVVLLLLLIQQKTLGYNPYPSILFPEFDPWTGLIFCGLICPAFLSRRTA
jgi:energy-coupling factor transport system permease protein